MADEGTPGELPPRQRKSPRDWEDTFQQWIRSGIPKAKFLKSLGLNNQSGYVHKKTKDWDKRLELYAAGVKDTHTAAMIDKAMKGNSHIANEVPASLPEKVPAAPEATVMDVAPMVGRKADDVKAQAQPSIWQSVQDWRRKQAKTDYETAEQARLAIRILLKDSIKRTNVDGREVLTTKLRAHEIRQLTQAMADVQRVQRLALGLSTENVGIDNPTPQGAGAHVEKNVTPTEEAIPTFVVEMSSRGKFLRPRPRRAN